MEIREYAEAYDDGKMNAFNVVVDMIKMGADLEQVEIYCTNRYKGLKSLRRDNNESV